MSCHHIINIERKKRKKESKLHWRPQCQMTQNMPNQKCVNKTSKANLKLWPSLGLSVTSMLSAPFMITFNFWSSCCSTCNNNVRLCCWPFTFCLCSLPCFSTTLNYTVLFIWYSSKRLYRLTFSITYCRWSLKGWCPCATLKLQRYASTLAQL